MSRDGNKVGDGRRIPVIPLDECATGAVRQQMPVVEFSENNDIIGNVDAISGAAPSGAAGAPADAAGIG
jgi:hypothetical protein